MPSTERAEDREYKRRLAEQQAAARAAAQPSPRYIPSDVNRWNQIMQAQVVYPKQARPQPQQSAVRRWDEIMRAQGVYPAATAGAWPSTMQTIQGWESALPQGRAMPTMQPVLQSRLPTGWTGAALPQYGGGGGGGYTRSYGGGGGGGWGGGYPNVPQQSALWWDPGLYNWRYGVSY